MPVVEKKVKIYKDIGERWNCNLQKKGSLGSVVFRVCILSAKGKDSYKCLSEVWVREYSDLFDNFETYGELGQNPPSSISVVIATLASKIKTWSVQLTFIDCVLFNTDHCPISFTLKAFLHMVNV